MAESAGAALGGLIFIGLAEVPQVMSAWLPSPTTAYQGGSDPKRVAMLTRGMWLGSAQAMFIAAGVTLVAGQDYGARAWLIFLAAAAMLGAFLWEYRRAMKLGEAEVGAVQAAY